MDTTTWRATIGAGTLLGELDKRLHNHNRAMAHGTCPKVGIGGHATIGGLGPTSRQWGAALDHVEEVEVVLANSTIVRASPSQNPDLFWALKGAGASFGVITEFIVRTEPEPGKAIQFSFTFSYGSYPSMAPTFKLWQEFIADPQLTRLFASEVVITQLGMVISGTYFGPKEEYEKFQLSEKFFHAQSSHILVFDDWLGVAGHWAEEEALLLSSGLPVNLVANSLVFNEMTLIPDKAINDLFKYLDDTKKGTPLWFVIFDLEGGAVNDVPQDATAYAHRDALFYMQSYAVGIEHLSETTREFIAGVNEVIEKGMPEVEFGAYAGYVDPKLDNPQKKYWGSNLERLERIKAVVDPEERFWNPQSIRPSKKEAVTGDKVQQEL
jgi:FAD/FMN-containing dehydrogenase